MAGRSLVFLMYHELESPGRPLCESEPGYVRYILSRNLFQSQIHWLREKGWRGLCVSEALDYPEGDSVAITFDDGCETDLVTAAPILSENHMNATFYITAGHIGRRGYLSRGQLQQLSAMGFEIGCHSMTHAYLDDLNRSDLQREVWEAKKTLEDFIGRPVEHFSCPGGRYDAQTVATVQAAGYRSMATSHPRANSPATNPFSLGRVPILRNFDRAAFERVCTMASLRQMQCLEFVRGSARRLLGNQLYDRFRALVLRER